MISKSDVRELIDALFEEEALVIGGLVAVHRLDDDLVWRLMRNLDVVRGRFLRRIEAQDSGESAAPAAPNLKPHPAIEDFILGIRRARQ